MARKGILTTDITRPQRRESALKPPVKPTSGAVGALQSSLTKLQESAVQEVDPKLIFDAGVEDRLGFDTKAHAQLKESLATYGQQVPVLLRPHARKPGRYEIVYGRRRLKALKELGQPVKAMVRQLDDHDLVMAQGQENTARQDLSFIEKASFAAQLEKGKYDRPTIAAALSVDQPMVSRLLRVGQAFPLPFLRAIGAAPSIGRDRWMALIKAYEAKGKLPNKETKVMRRPAFSPLNSDERFEAVFAEATEVIKPEIKKGRPAAHKPRTLRARDGTPLGDIRATVSGVTLSVPARKDAPGFDTWINANAETLLADLHDRWTREGQKDGSEEQ
jgi:ParB family chromosome partitioning protein